MKITQDEAIDLLNQDKVVALPTETVYGLASKLSSERGIKKIFSLKNRPLDNPLIIHLSSKKDLQTYLLNKEKNTLFDLIEHFWPGPLTVVVEVNTDKIPDIARAHLKTAAFRIPKSEETLDIITQVGPLVMPSANLSGKPSATRIDHVLRDFGEDFPVLDGGITEKGLESTVIVQIGERWKIARRGAITEQDLKKVLGYKPETHNSKEQVLSPGTKYKHYAPKAQLIPLNQNQDFSLKTVIGFSNRNYPHADKIYSIGSSLNPKEISQKLYHVLRQLDVDGVEKAYVDFDIPKENLYKTILERLERASK